MAAFPLDPESVPASAAEAFARARENFDMAQADLDDCGWTNDERDYAVDIQRSALYELLQTPAPDVAALAYKLTIFEAECLEAITEERPVCFAALIADARRLAG